MRLIAFFVLSLSLQASEVDSWTEREFIASLDPEAALTILNTKTNELMDKAEIEANETPNCDKTALYNATYANLANRSGLQEASVEYYIKHDPGLEGMRSCLSDKDSIYSEFTWSDFFASRVTSQAVGCTINVRGKAIGSDKFGHFLATGYTYFKRAKLQKNFTKALDYGHNSEETYFGFMGTGIFSYGDLNANYEGMRFWSMLTEEFTKSKKAYFRCVDNHWVRQREFKWEEYVNVSWDEAVNTSYFRTKEIWDKFKTKLVALGYQFPLDKDLCREVYNRHKGNKRVAKALISPRCALLIKEELPQDLQEFFENNHLYMINDSEHQITWRKIFSSVMSAIRDEILFW